MTADPASVRRVVRQTSGASTLFNPLPFDTTRNEH
jgi:hypothetical protein